MPRPSDKEIIAGLVAEFEPKLKQAFLEAIADLRNSVVLETIVERLERNDIPGAIAALNIEPEAFSRVELAILEAYNSGGIATTGNMPKVRDPEGRVISLRWGVRNLPAEQAMRAHAADMVSGVTANMKEGLREVLTEGLARGQNPRATARDVVGRRSRASNTRVGGYLGLTQRQMQTVDWVKQALLDNDVEGLKRYLGMTNDMIGMPRRELLRALKDRGLKQRDRRFDGSIIDAIEGKSKIGKEGAVKVYTQYAERALDYRGRVVSRHETMVALSKSRHDAFQQQIDAGKIDQQDVTMTWKHTPREHPRMQHIAMAGQNVAFGEAFIAPDETRIRYPHDPDAPAYHTISCMCRVEYSIDFTAAALRRYKARVGQ